MTADRQDLLTQELSDLPEEALLNAIERWQRGDRSHLSDFEQASTRVGVFFPKPAELRMIANAFLRKQRAELSRRDREQSIENERKYRDEHPEDYVTTAELQMKIDALNAKLGFTTPEPETRTHVELTKEHVMRLTSSDLRALANALDLRALKQHRERTEVNATAASEKEKHHAAAGN